MRHGLNKHCGGGIYAREICAVAAGTGHCCLVAVPHPVGRRELEVAPDVARLLRGPHASDQVLPLGRQRAAHQPRTITQVVVQSTSVTVAQITSN